MSAVNAFDGPHLRWTAGLCANCEAPLNPTPSIKLFCDDYCREWAKHVRYFRATWADGRAYLDPLVAEALRTRMAFILAGGYPAGARRLSSEVRSGVLARNGGWCAVCGTRPAVEVDHIDGDSPDPSNLQGLCHVCHQAKTESHYVPMDDRDREVRDAFLAYVEESEPVMLAHSERWTREWRALSKENLHWALERCVVTEYQVVHLPDGTTVLQETPMTRQEPVATP